jgi:hypothetical protein
MQDHKVLAELVVLGDLQALQVVLDLKDQQDLVVYKASKDVLV